MSTEKVTPAAAPADAAAADAAADAAKVTAADYGNERKPTWCPGCGDFGILTAVKQALVEQAIAPHQVAVISGIGCGSKLPDYMRVNGMLTLHGRPLPIATGVKLANPGLHVLVVDGDGDAYGIGGNHFLHTCRRNPDITHLVEDNQIYALTKGQYSPTSMVGFRTTTSPEGVVEQPVKPLALALAAGAGFVARGFAGEPKKLASLIVAAMRHPGYALIDVLQPCVTFNKVNTYDWYAERVYDLNEEEGYDPRDFDAAWRRAQEFGDRIPTGVLYRREGVEPYEKTVPGLKRGWPAHSVGRPLPDGLYRELEGEFL